MATLYNINEKIFDFFESKQNSRVTHPIATYKGLAECVRVREVLNFVLIFILIFIVRVISRKSDPFLGVQKLKNPSTFLNNIEKLTKIL